jgi:hypothetical protein
MIENNYILNYYEILISNDKIRIGINY